VLVPAYRRHRQRYAQYQPVGGPWPSSLATSTSSLRQRLTAVITTVVVPSRWASGRMRRRRRVVDAEGERPDEEMGDMADDTDVDEDEGAMVPGRRDAVSLDQREGLHSDRRLSRELEEGFRDSSDDEDGPGR